MLHHNASHQTLAKLSPDLLIAGGGPLGIIAGLAAAERGQTVLILESGQDAVNARAQSLSEDTILTPDTHHAPTLTTARRLGGASNLWGGRCVPFDPIDYRTRPWLDLDAWPINESDLAPYMDEALALLGAGSAVFTDLIAPSSDKSDFTTDRLERWTNQPRTQVFHKDALAAHPDLHIALGVSLTGITRDAKGLITEATVFYETDQAHHPLPVKHLILACGGNATTKLMLNLQAEDPALFGGSDGPLGRFYMGHVNGQIADITFHDKALHDAFDYYVDDHGSYVRRRIAPSDTLQKDQKLTNMTFWPVVPEIAQPEHKSGPLSAVFLGLSTPVLGKKFIAEAIRLKHIGAGPYKRLPHILNILRDPISTLLFVPSFLYRRKYAKFRVPAFFLKNPGRRYGLEFHAEHLPNPDSRITLGTTKDHTGLYRTTIDFRFSHDDAAPILRAHTALEHWLQDQNLGALSYRYDDPKAGIFIEAQHGNHQVGTIRMGKSPKDGVVDGFGTSFDIPNLHVISTAILPTSSQANPTLTAAQAGLRLIDRLSKG